MLKMYLTAGLRLVQALRPIKTSRTPVAKSIQEKGYDEYRFPLEDLRCSICSRRPHPGLTRQLSGVAKTRGIIHCEIHGPVESEVRISVNERPTEKKAA